jgi:hypothetical protein
MMTDEAALHGTNFIPTGVFSPDLILSVLSAKTFRFPRIILDFIPSPIVRFGFARTPTHRRLLNT